MHISLHTNWAPKQGNRTAEYEDAAAFLPKRHVVHCAVADGAAESSFSGQWARMLCKAYVEGRLRPSHWEQHMAALCQEWSKLKPTPSSLPWYAQEKAALGAHAAFLGLSVYRSPHGGLCRWRALVVGDCCLFIANEGSLKVSFPFVDPTSFNSHPPLISSCKRNIVSNKHMVNQASGEWLAGDRFYLMSDALAQWFCTKANRGEKPWLEWEELSSNTGFSHWVEQLRRGGELKNDDVTLVRLSTG